MRLGPMATLACQWREPTAKAPWMRRSVVWHLRGAGGDISCGRGKGYKDGAEDVRLFRAALLDGYLQPEPEEFSYAVL